MTARQEFASQTIFVDAAVQEGDEIFDFGAAVMDLRGGLQAALQGFKSVASSVLIVEAQAIIEGLRLAQRLNVQRVIIKSDSLSCVHMINGDHPIAIEVKTIIQDILALNDTFQIKDLIERENLFSEENQRECCHYRNHDNSERNRHYTEHV